MHADSGCPRKEKIGQQGGAHVTHTMRKLTVWKRWATESLTKKAIALGENTVSSCQTLPQEEWMRQKARLSGTTVHREGM
jgi:hypothetical protein